MQDIEDLFLRYYKNLYHYLLSLTHDASKAEDLVSETFCKALQSLANFKEQSSAKTWLFSIAYHVWQQQLDKQKHAPAYDAQLLELCTEDTTHAVIANQETLAHIKSLLAQKDTLTQTILGLRIQGMSFAEIGERLHITRALHA